MKIYNQLKDKMDILFKTNENVFFKVIQMFKDTCFTWVDEEDTMEHTGAELFHRALELEGKEDIKGVLQLNENLYYYFTKTETEILNEINILIKEREGR